MTALTCSRLSPSYHCMMSSTLAPASRFSKMADTGIRVPFKTHAPLTLPGMLSTAGHFDQSRLAIFASLLLDYRSLRFQSTEKPGSEATGGPQYRRLLGLLRFHTA